MKTTYEHITATKPIKTFNALLAVSLAAAITMAMVMLPAPKPGEDKAFAKVGYEYSHQGTLKTYYNIGFTADLGAIRQVRQSNFTVTYTDTNPSDANGNTQLAQRLQDAGYTSSSNGAVATDNYTLTTTYYDTKGESSQSYSYSVNCRIYVSGGTLYVYYLTDTPETIPLTRHRYEAGSLGGTYLVDPGDSSSYGTAQYYAPSTTPTPVSYKYSLNVVTNPADYSTTGSGSDCYLNGANVSVSVDTAGTGKVFEYWEKSGNATGSFANNDTTLASTTYTIGTTDDTLTAVLYNETPQLTLDMQNYDFETTTDVRSFPTVGMDHSQGTVSWQYAKASQPTEFQEFVWGIDSSGNPVTEPTQLDAGDYIMKMLVGESPETHQKESSITDEFSVSQINNEPTLSMGDSIYPVVNDPDPAPSSENYNKYDNVKLLYTYTGNTFQRSDTATPAADHEVQGPDDGNHPVMSDNDEWDQPSDATGDFMTISSTDISVKPTQAGKYHLQVTFPDDGNFYVAYKDTDFIVKKADFQDGLSIAVDDWTYGDNPPLQSIIHVNGMPADHSGINELQMDSIAPAPADTYKPYITYHYQGKAFTATDTSNRQEDGTLPEATGEPYEGDTMPTAAGVYKVTVYVEQDGNYLPASASSEEFVISKADNKATLAIASWSFDETPNSPVISLLPRDYSYYDDTAVNNLAEGGATYRYMGYAFTNSDTPDNASGAYYNSAETPANAGIYTVTMVLRPDGNYKGSIKSADFTISKADYTASVTINGWVYDSYNAAENAPVQGQLPGDYGRFNGESQVDAAASHTTYNYSGNAYTDADTATAATGAAYDSADPPTNAGLYTLTMSVEQDDSYAAQSATADFTVQRAGVTPAVSIEGWTEGDTPNPPATTGIPADDNTQVSYFYSGTAASGLPYGSDNPPDVAGDYTVQATWGQTGNYASANATAGFTVAPVPAAAPDNSGMDRSGDRGASPALVRSGHWSIINLLGTVCTLLLAAMSIILLAVRKRQSRAAFIVVNAVLGIGSAVLFLLTQDLLSNMVIADRLTPLFVALAIVALLLRLMPVRERQEDDRNQGKFAENL